MLSRNLVVATLYVLSFLLEPRFGAKEPELDRNHIFVGTRFWCKGAAARYLRSTGASK